MPGKHEKAHTEALLINEAKKLDPGSNCEYAVREPRTGREPMTHEIVQSVKTLAARLAKHSENAGRAKEERLAHESAVLVRALSALPGDLLDLLNPKCTHLTIAQHGEVKFSLLRPADGGPGLTWGVFPAGEAGTRAALDEFTLEELLSGLVAALAERIDNKHEAGKKVARTCRRLRGILSILDNT